MVDDDTGCDDADDDDAAQSLTALHLELQLDHLHLKFKVMH